jgi:hypothetical protein
MTYGPGPEQSFSTTGDVASPSTVYSGQRALCAFKEGLEFRRLSQNGQIYDVIFDELDLYHDIYGSAPDCVNAVIGAHQGKSYRAWRNSIGSVAMMMQGAYYDHLQQDYDLISLWKYFSAVTTKLKKAVNDVVTLIADNDITLNEYNDLLSRIKSDPEFGKLALISLTRDQISLNRYLLGSMGQTNREYPYLPATKAIMINQAKNLATFSTHAHLLETNDSGRKRVLAIGVPAGLLEKQRNEYIDSTGDLSWRESNLCKLNIWRRNLKDESEITQPKSFMFDTSRFILEGRRTALKRSSNSLDAADTYKRGQSLDDLYNKIVMYEFEPEGAKSASLGNLINPIPSTINLNASADLLGIDAQNIFQNHVVDYYLKIYMMLTTGIDMFEDIFPFLESEVFFDGVDEGKEKLFEELKVEAGEKFAIRDATSAINYDRLVGELKRSILLSPKKWRNRIVYPKIFDRVFCVLIDEDDWETTSSTSANSSSGFGAEVAGIPVFDGEPKFDSIAADGSKQGKNRAESPTYYQFYATISLLPNLDDFLPGATSTADSGTSLKKKKKNVGNVAKEVPTYGTFK